MKKSLLSRKGFLLAFSVLFLNVTTDIYSQDYNWTGSTDGNFYNAANWTSTSGSVVFDNSSFKVVRTHTVLKNAPVINQIVNWQPGIFDNTGGSLIVNADFNVFFNDKLNGTVTVNTGATFTCRNIFRVGREGVGTLNVNGGTFISNNTDTWQGVFIGVLSGGNGTANINNGGVINGGYQLEIGTRDFYPKGLLNINTGATAQAYWTTAIGPNGTVNIDGGILNAGQVLSVGDLFVDTPGSQGTTGAIIGKLNIKSGTVVVNQNDLVSPALNLNAKAKVTIDQGSLVIKRTGRDFTQEVNAYVAGGQIVPAAGKEIEVVYDGVLTKVTARTLLGINDFYVAESTFEIYPNPVQETINILVKGNFIGDLKVSVLNLIGQTMIKSQIVKANSGSYILDSKNKLASGMYLVQINTGTATISKKIIVK